MFSNDLSILFDFNSFLQDVIDDNEQTSQHSEASGSSYAVRAPSMMAAKTRIIQLRGRMRTAKEGIIMKRMNRGKDGTSPPKVTTQVRIVKAKTAASGEKDELKEARNNLKAQPMSADSISDSDL